MKLKNLFLISAATVMSSSGLFGQSKLAENVVSGGASLAVGNIMLADPFTSASKAVAASSLTAKTATGFKKRQLAAARLEAGQLLFNLAGLVAGGVSAKGLYDKYRDGNLTDDDREGSVLGAIALLSLLMRSGWSIKSIIQHMKYAKNAEKLHELMQNEEFKKSFGVTDWAKVRNRRYLAEAVSAGVAGSLNVLGLVANITGFKANVDRIQKNMARRGHFPYDKDNRMKKAAALAGFVTAGLSLSPLVVKPTISRLIRQKGSARGLKAAFNKAIKEGFNEQ